MIIKFNLKIRNYINLYKFINKNKENCLKKEKIKEDNIEIEHQNNFEEISKNNKKKKARREFLV